MSGGTTTSDQQSQSVSQIPQWMQQAGQQNYAYAQDVAAQPLQQYQGQLVADVAPQTQQAWNLAASSGGVGQDQYNASTAGYLNSLGQTVGGVTDPGNASSIRASTLGNTNLSRYMNPYTQSVINTTLPIMQQQLAQSQIQNQNSANSANAFGGSRQGVQQGVTQAQGAQNMAQMASQLNQANYTQAQQGAQFDVGQRNQIATTNQASQQANLNRNLAAQTTNQSAQQAKINSDILASQGLTNTGNALNQANLQNYNMLTSSGAGQSMQAQSQINAQQQKFQQAVNYPQQQLATLLSSLGMTPHDTSTTGAQQTQTTTPTDWANVLTQGLGAAADVWKASDKRVKKNIISMGSDPLTGVPIKSFNFKGEAPGMPKTIGPLAQDVQKAAPGSVQPMAGGVLSMPRSTMVKATPSIATHPSFAGNKPTIMGALGSPSALNKFMPPKSAALGALAKPRAGAKGLGGLANTKRGMASVVGAYGG